VRPYAVAFLSGARRTLNAPGDLAVRTLFYVIILIVFSALWDAAIDANDGVISGYTYIAVLWYIAAAEGAVVATKPRMIEDIGDDIATGAIAVEMLRPVSVVGFRMAVEFGESCVRLAGVVVVGAMLVGLHAGAPPDAGAAWLAIPSLLVAIACNLAAQHAFAASAFWLEDAKGAWFLYQKVIFLLGGMLLPLEFIPQSLEAVALVLPFWTMAYAPARLMAGHFEPALLLGQIVWFAVLLVAARAAFAAGERKLQVAGG
jgi:ABC-2 type transport system permease protein